MPDQLLVIVAGPTASGKSALSITLAQHFQTVVVSADSRQFYKDLPVGTAQPSAAELQSVKHYFIGDLEVEETLSAGTYATWCRQLLATLFNQHQVVILTGGSGLYIDAVVNGVDSFPDADLSIRDALNRTFQEQGIEALQEELKQADPDYFQRVDLQNPRRLVRALEVCRTSGKPYSSFLGKDATPLPWPHLMIGINWQREMLYDRINKRVDEMLEAGLEQEARAMLPKRHLNALHTVGYTELFAHFDGTLSRDEAINLIKQNTRNYAKRQMTWCRGQEEMIWFDPGQDALITAKIENELAK